MVDFIRPSEGQSPWYDTFNQYLADVEDLLNSHEASIGTFGQSIDDLSNADALKVSKTGDTMSGDLNFGTTNKVIIGTDTNLYRSAANTLKTDDIFVVNTNAAVSALSVTNTSTGGGVYISMLTGTTNAVKVLVTGENQYRYLVDASGKLTWGSGSASGDTNLYRSAADTLKTDDSLIVGGALTVNGVSLGTWTDYTPTLGTGWSIGNGTVTARYAQIGKTVLFSVYLVWGSTSTWGTAGSLEVSLPVTVATGKISMGSARGFKTAVGSYMWQWYTASTTIARVYSAGTGGLATNITATAPFTHAAGDSIAISGTYEAA